MGPVGMAAASLVTARKGCQWHIGASWTARRPSAPAMHFDRGTARARSRPAGAPPRHRNGDTLRRRTWSTKPGGRVPRDVLRIWCEASRSVAVPDAAALREPVAVSICRAGALPLRRRQGQPHGAEPDEVWSAAQEPSSQGSSWRSSMAAPVCLNLPCRSLASEAAIKLDVIDAPKRSQSAVQEPSLYGLRADFEPPRVQWRLSSLSPSSSSLTAE